MANTKSITNANKTNVAKTTKVEEKVENASANLDLQKTNEQLQNDKTELENKLEAMMKMIENLQSVKDTAEKVETPEQIVTVEEFEPIDMNKRITVTSITTGGVNLKTSNDGTAKQFRLEKLGQTIPMSYEHLINCMNTDRWVFEEGLVYINDPSVIRSEYLEEQYKKFLDINKINNIMDFDVATIKHMISNTTEEIQETIVTVIANKINNGEYLDMNKVDVIEKSCKREINIRDIANQIR